MHTEDLPIVTDSVLLREALEVLNAGGLGLVAIVDADNILKGVLSDGDVRREVCCGPFDVDRPVVEVMTASPKRATVGEDVGPCTGCHGAE